MTAWWSSFPGDRFGRERSSGRALGFAGTASGPLAGDDLAGDEKLAAPHAARLGPLESGLQARVEQRALETQVFGELDLGGRVGEPQVGVMESARKSRDVVMTTAVLMHRKTSDGRPGSWVDPGGSVQPVRARIRWN